MGCGGWVSQNLLESATDESRDAGQSLRRGFAEPERVFGQRRERTLSVLSVELFLKTEQDGAENLMRTS